VVTYYKDLLMEVNQIKKIKTDILFDANVITYLLAFLPLRGWNLKNRENRKHVEAIADFILRGLCLQ
jgi:hypothetical protein